MRKHVWLLKALTLFLLAISSGISASHWEVPLEVSQALAGPDTFPIIVADHEDNASVIWQQDGDIYTSYCPFGGTWDTPTSHGQGREHTICVDEGGNVTIAFVHTSTTEDIMVNFRPFGGSWAVATASSIYTTVGAAKVRTLSMDCVSNNYYGYIAWREDDGTTFGVRSLHRTGSGMGWVSSPVIVQGAVAIDSTANPIIKTKSDGNTAVVFRGNIPAYDLYVAFTTSPSGEYTQYPLGFISSVGTDYDFAMDSNTGNAVIAAVAVSGVIQAATSVYGTSTSWSPIANVSAFRAAEDVHVGMDQNGLASAIWKTSSYPAMIQMANETAGGTSWSTIIDLSEPSHSNVNDPRIHFSRNGYRIVAWNDGNTDAAPHNLVALRGEGITMEPPSTNLDSEMMKGTLSIFTSTTSRGFATWIDHVGNQFVEASVSFEPIIINANNSHSLRSKK